MVHPKLDCTYRIRFTIRRVGDTILEFDEIYIDNFKLTYENENEIRVETKIKSDTPDLNIREIITSEVNYKIIPVLALISSSGYIFDPNSVSYGVECKENNKVVLKHTFSNIVRIEARNLRKVSKPFVQKEINELINFWKYLDDETRKDIARAVRFWSRGLADDDPIDKFINYYIAFEIIGKNIYKYNEKTWVTDICKEHELECKYDGYKVNDIRAALLHSRHTKHRELTKEKAEEIVVGHADQFGNNIFYLLNNFINRTKQS